MKINVFVSLAKAASAWLHGEGGSHFRAYTYPRIKQTTRKFINLGIYEYFEGFYKIVDDTFYNGTVEVQPQDPVEVERLERLASQMEDGELDYDMDAGVDALPTYASIKNKIFLWKGLEQGRTYRCGTFTMNNMLRTAMLKKGLKPELEVTAIDPLYVKTKHGRGQTGTVMDNAFAYLAKNGFPIPSWSPRMTDHNKELVDLERNDAVENASLFPTVKTTGNIMKAFTFQEAVSLDQSLPDNWEMQVSINFSASLKYFGQLVPYLAKVNGKYSLVRTGGHSVHGVRGSFSTWEDGEAGFAIIDSAYRSSEDGWRFLQAKLFTFGVLSVRFVELEIEGNTVTPAPTPTPSPTPSPINEDQEILAQKNISFGENNANVKALQRYLIASGYTIPAGATGYFGGQTQTALKGWQDAQFGAKYDGTYWGSISQRRYIELHNLG